MTGQRHKAEAVAAPAQDRVLRYDLIRLPADKGIIVYPRFSAEKQIDLHHPGHVETRVANAGIAEGCRREPRPGGFLPQGFQTRHMVTVFMRQQDQVGLQAVLFEYTKQALGFPGVNDDAAAFLRKYIAVALCQRVNRGGDLQHGDQISTP